MEDIPSRRLLVPMNEKSKMYPLSASHECIPDRRLLSVIDRLSSQHDWDGLEHSCTAQYTSQ